MPWSESALQCALGTMLDKDLLEANGRVRRNTESMFTKRVIVGYALYLHVRGRLFDDKQMTLDRLERHLMRATKTDVVSMINARLGTHIRTRTTVRGTRSPQLVEVSVRKQQSMR
jgi:hypothetical protein